MRQVIGAVSVAVALATTGCGGGGSDKTETTNARGYSTNGPALAKSDYASKIKAYLEQAAQFGTNLQGVTAETSKSDVRDLANQARNLANGVSELNPPAEFQADNAAVATYARRLADDVDKLVDAGDDKTKASEIVADIRAATQAFAGPRADLREKLGV